MNINMREQQKFKTFVNMSGLSEEREDQSKILPSFKPFVPSEQFEPLSSPKGNFFHSDNGNEFKKEPEEQIELSPLTPKIQNYKSNRYPTEVSMMKSDISVASTMHLDEHLPLTLRNLEMNLTQNILSLREEKITLMEDYNQTLADKYRLEREIVKLEKLTERSYTDPEDLTISIQQEIDPALMKNRQLKKQYQQLQITNQELSTQKSQDINKISNLRDKSKQLELQIQKLQEKSRESQEKRFETFFPQKSKTNKIQLLRKLHQLKNKKKQLLDNLAFKSYGRTKDILMNLLRERISLDKECNELLAQRKVKGSTRLKVHHLRQMIQNEQRSKILFFEDLQNLKVKMESLKTQNERLRSER